LRPRLIAIFLVIVIAPLGLLGWLGVRLARDEQEAVRARMQALLESGLADTRTVIERVVERRRRELLELTDVPTLEPGVLRKQGRRQPVVLQLFALGRDCGRIHPPVDGPLTRDEREFAARAGGIWPDMLAICRAGSRGANANANEPTPEATTDAGAASSMGSSASAKASASAVNGEAQRLIVGGGAADEDHGWYVRPVGGSGADVFFWRRHSAGGLVGAELDSIRLMADIVAELPHAGVQDAESPQGRTVLEDASGRVLYQWGDAAKPDDGGLAAELSPRHPLAAWTLRRSLPGSALAEAMGGSVRLSLITSLIAAGLVLLGLAAYFLTQQSRLMREAARKVGFVNRVSHELRTPLTNIRLYAELLEGRLGEADDKSKNQLEVIVSESQRLSRLIGNVLAFSRGQQGRLRVHPTRGRVDDVIRTVLEHFSVSLADREVAVTFEAGAEAEVLVDGDALEQILGNLVGNVEKYAPSGGLLEITSRQEGERTAVRVADRGPGIPAGQRDRVFEPFHRLSDKLTDGVSGTGLGLGIARDLARLHGGDLKVVPSERGTCLELTLNTPPASGESR